MSGERMTWTLSPVYRGTDSVDGWAVSWDQYRRRFDTRREARAFIRDHPAGPPPLVRLVYRDGRRVWVEET